MVQEQANGAGSFAALLRQHRLAAGLTQEALVERAGVSVRGIQGLEGAANRPLRDTTRRLAAALDLAAEERARFLAAAGPGPRAPRERDATSQDASASASVGALAPLSSAASRSPLSSAGVPSPPSSQAAMPAARTPRIEAPPSPRHNLPLQLTRFVGRQTEIAEVAALLEQTRLLTLTGTGGVGKTRLALAVAEHMQARYPDGVWLIELAALSDPTLLSQSIAAALGLRGQPGRPIEETLVEAVRTRGQLLVLDNCEHLRDACARLAETLLRACPNLQILATSREPLGLAGETAWRVPSLALPNPTTLPALEELARVEAVQLFVTRARAVHPHFALTEANAAALVRVCSRLDGIPLALELAAAQVRALGVEQLAARMDRQFQVLAGGSRTALPRQQTLRATVDWSYALLTPQEQTLFARLAVFAGGGSLEAAEAVGAGGAIVAEDVLGLLVRLVDTSLVLAVDAGTRDEAGGAGLRYRLLEPLRQYAQERLEAGEEEARAARERHAAYYLSLAEEAEPHLRGVEHGAWLERLEAERDNLRVALRWCVEQGAAEEALRLVAPQYWFWIRRRGGWAEYRAQVLQALALPGAAPSRARANAAIAAGYIMILQGERAAGQRLLEEAEMLGRQFDDHVAIAGALFWLGTLAFYGGDYAQARTLLEESLAHYRTLSDQWGVAEALCCLSRAVMHAGDDTQARILLDDALALARRQGEPRHMAFALEIRGQLAYTSGNLAEAGWLWTESLTHYSGVGDVWGMATIESFLGDLQVRQGDYGAARSHYTASLEGQRRSGWPLVSLAQPPLAGLAVVAGVEGQAEQAIRLAAAATALGAAAGIWLPLVQAALEQAIVAARTALGEHGAAAAWTEGEAMTLQEAIAHALQDTVTTDV